MKIGIFASFQSPVSKRVIPVSSMVNVEQNIKVVYLLYFEIYILLHCKDNMFSSITFMVENNISFNLLF